MKHSAKAVAKLAREREKQASLAARADSAGRQAGGNGVGAPESAAWSAPVRPASAIAARSRAGARWLAQLPYTIVLAGILLGLGAMRGGAEDVRGGTLVMAGALLAGALARLVLPEGRIGLLGSRRRLVDAAVLTALGVGLLIAGLIAKVPG